jgi:hypothetical protein
MSHPSRPQARSAAKRRRCQVRIEPLLELETRQVLTPFIPINGDTATFTAATAPTNDNLGTVTVNQGGGAALASSAAAFTSVAELTPNSSFGGDIVRIAAGPGGDFGEGVYAISRGAGANASKGAVNRPGVIYRVDPATGKSSVFFDLNTVISQLEPGGTAANSAGTATGLVNWYDIAFDPEGYFDGKPSMFVTSIDRLDPNKNAIFRIGPDGSFMGAFVSFSAGGTTGAGLVRGPSSVLIPPPEQQSFLRGLVAGDGFSTSTQGFAALFFDANSFPPGTDLNSTTTLPTGVTATPLTFGPQVGITAANSNYRSQDYSAFTNFGTPAVGPIPGAPGLSGVQGILGELLINGGAPIVNSFTAAGGATPDTAAAIITPFRRFEDIAFDQYGYFSYGTTVTPSATGGRPTVGTIPPGFVGSVFVSDLATGLAVTVTPQAPFNTTPVNIPVQGSGTVGVTTDASGNVVPIFSNGNTTGGTNIGGRIIRISPGGVITTFAEGFNTSGDQTSNGFVQSDLSISFSADGTILYASDNDGIWQFKTVTDLASSTAGSIVGLNDLRSLGAPYDGQGSAVAVIDTGVDVLSPPLRGRVSTGFNTLTNGTGNDDTAPATLQAGHGTPVAGVITQFVPQATIDPINIFTPGVALPTSTSSDILYNGMNYLTQHPFVQDPVRPGIQDRVIAANFGFGTTTTYDTEGSAFRKNPHVVIALKNQLKKFNSLGIAPVAAAGQLGAPVGTAGSATIGDLNGIALPAVLNEVISVSGVYPFPFTATATTPPTDPGLGVVPRPVGPVLLYGNGTTITVPAAFQNIVASDVLVFADKILNSSNRSLTTDYVAPEIDVPTFQRTFVGDGGVFNVFQQVGTSYSSAMVSGSIALVASALDYWTRIANTGVTSDAYLTTPVGVNTLNFGANQLLNLSAYANPNSINSILQWTAVPATDSSNPGETVLPPQLFGSTHFREFSRLDVGNAIAAIEGSVAINYLLAHGTFNVIDANKDGLITAQEIQTFVDNSTTIGMPEAGAMARLLGGTARIPTTGFRPTAVGELPDQPDVLQRRFNFFDYAANGTLKGAVSIQQLQMLAKNLLPAPDAFNIVDRQRASVNGYLLSPPALRNYSDLQHILPRYAFVPKSVVARWRNISPARFGVGRELVPGSFPPFYTLFESPITKKAATVSNAGSHTTTTTTGNNNTTTTPTGTTTGANNGAVSSTGGTQTGTTQPALPSQGAPVTGSPTNQGASQTSFEQSLLNAVTQLATNNGNNGSASQGIPTTTLSPPSQTTTPGAATPAGTLLATNTNTQTTTTQTTSTTPTGTKTTTPSSPVAQTSAPTSSTPKPKAAAKPKKNNKFLGGAFDYLGKLFRGK